MEKTIKIFILVTSLMLIYLTYQVTTTKHDIQEIKSVLIDNNSVSMKMSESIEKYCEQYDVPLYIAYNVAYKETTYRGPFDFKYKHNLTSSVGAVGPMQVMLATAQWINKTKKIKIDKLKNDVDYNVHTSIKLLAHLYKQKHDWNLVAGCYNTGKWITNSYSEYVSGNKNYKSKWIELNPDKLWQRNKQQLSQLE